MTYLGTRPPTVDEWDKYELHHRARLATKPGLTGMWQVSGRSNITDLGNCTGNGCQSYMIGDGENDIKAGLAAGCKAVLINGEWLNTKHPKLNIVCHEDFIPQKFLPTFNSHTIEWNFHRIPGLTEQFVYFNDDMFLLKPVYGNLSV